MPSEYTSCSMKYLTTITDAEAVFFRTVNANNVE
jgi:hypothetical protein